MVAVQRRKETTEKGRDVMDVHKLVWRDECRYALGDDAPIRIRRKAAVLRAAGPRYSKYARADKASVKSGVTPTLGQVAHSANQRLLCKGRC